MSKVVYRVQAVQDLEYTEVKRGDLVALYQTNVAEPHVLTRHIHLDPGIVLVGLNTGVLEPIILTHGDPASSSREAVERAVAETLRPPLRLVRSMG